LRKKFNKTKKSEGPTYFEHNTRVGSLVDDEVFSQVRSSARVRISEIVNFVRAGEFPAVPNEESQCERCSIRPVCRIRARAAEPSVSPALDPEWAHKIRHWANNCKPLGDAQEKAGIKLSDAKLLW